MADTLAQQNLFLVESSLNGWLPKEDDRRLLLGQLLDSVSDANSLAPHAWAVTFAPGGNPGFRLNVGKVETFVFYGELIRLNLAGERPNDSALSPFLTQTDYKSIHDEQWSFVAPVGIFRQFQDILRPFHEAFLLEAALTKSGQPIQGSSFLSSHSPELISYACRLLGRDEDEFRRVVKPGRSRLRLQARELRKIKREHILRAIRDLDSGVAHAFGESTDFDLVFEEKCYPPKAVFGLAGTHALNRDLKPEHFSAGENSVCFKVLTAEGFTIVKKASAFLLTWNPDQFPEESFAQQLEALESGEEKTLRWSVGNRKDLPVGSTLFLMRLGKDPKGIVGYATSTSAVYEGVHWDLARADANQTAHYVECKPFRMQLEPMIPLSLLTSRWPEFPWTPQGGGIQITDASLARSLGIACRAARIQRYWWVNHKQTFKAELDGGYIWSPKTSAGGKFNQTYENLTKVRPGDVVFSYANQRIQAVGVVSGEHSQAWKPSEFGTAGDTWAGDGWEVPIEWRAIQLPIVPKEHLERVAPLLPVKHSPIRSNGDGNQSCYLAAISQSLGDLLLSLAGGRREELLNHSDEAQRETEDNEVEAKIRKQKDLPNTEIEQIVKARRGQGRFRRALELFESGCRLTGLKDQRFLVASHMKPWAKCTSHAERLDGANGLLLAPHADKLFDGGWITFTEAGEIHVVCSSVLEILKLWGIDPEMNVGPFTREQSRYLEYHRENVFAERRAKLLEPTSDGVNKAY